MSSVREIMAKSFGESFTKRTKVNNNTVSIDEYIESVSFMESCEYLHKLNLLSNRRALLANVARGESGNTPQSDKKPGIFKRIFQAIRTIIKKIIEFFRKIFKKNKDVEKMMDYVGKNFENISARYRETFKNNQAISVNIFSMPVADFFAYRTDIINLSIELAKILVSENGGDTNLYDIMMDVKIHNDANKEKILRERAVEAERIVKILNEIASKIKNENISVKVKMKPHEYVEFAKEFFNRREKYIKKIDHEFISKHNYNNISPDPALTDDITAKVFYSIEEVIREMDNKLNPANHFNHKGDLINIFKNIYQSSQHLLLISEKLLYGYMNVSSSIGSVFGKHKLYE